MPDEPLIPADPDDPRQSLAFGVTFDGPATVQDEWRDDGQDHGRALGAPPGDVGVRSDEATATAGAQHVRLWQAGERTIANLSLPPRFNEVTEPDMMFPTQQVGRRRVALQSTLYRPREPHSG